MYVKSEELTQKQQPETLPKQSKVKLAIPLMPSVGDQTKCPQCDATARVVWLSQDKKTMGVQCPASHRETRRAESQYGATLAAASTKTKKNVIFLTATPAAQ